MSEIDDNLIDEESTHYFVRPMMYKKGNRVFLVRSVSKLKGEKDYSIITGTVYEKLGKTIVG